MIETQLAKMSGEEKVWMLGSKLGFRLSRAHGLIFRKNKGMDLAWNPLTDANAMLEVIKAMREKSFYVDIITLYPPQYRAKVYGAHGPLVYQADADDPKPAVLNACLLAIGE